MYSTNLSAKQVGLSKDRVSVARAYNLGPHQRTDIVADASTDTVTHLGPDSIADSSPNSVALSGAKCRAHGKPIALADTRCACMHTCMHTQGHAHSRTCTRTHARTLAHMHSRTHACMHAPHTRLLA